MVNIIISGAAGKHNCPLCLSKFIQVGEYLECRRCQIKIRVDDPLLGHWNDSTYTPADADIPCNYCRSKMRFFSRSDGYMKAFCPKCKGSIETADEKPGPGIKPGDLATPGKETK